MLPQQYCLRWKYHHSNLQTMFSQLLDRGCFCDVTLACEGQTLKAHRVVLCACSTYFDAILTNCCSEKDPIIIMKDAKFSDVKCLIEFMYKGEINVEHGSLASLLKTAEELKIKGLAEVSWREDENNTTQENLEENSSSHISTSTGNVGEQQQQQQQNQHQHQNQQQQQQQEHPQQQQQQITTPVGLPLLAPLSTIEKDSPSPPLPLKKKRGRPPLDGEFDSYSTPKIAHVDNGTPFADSSHLVSVMMDENSKEQLKESEAMSWAEQNLDTHMVYEDDEPPSHLIPKQERPETPSGCISAGSVIDGIGIGVIDGVGIGVMGDCMPEDGLSPRSDDPGTSSTQPLLLTALELEEWKDVIKMNDYLTKGRRPQFWEEPFTKRVMDSIKNKDLEMKKAAQILGVSYGTLYGRYRETYGCLKHPYRGPFMVSRLRDMWTEHCLAAELLNSSPTVSGYLDQSQDWNPSIDKDPQHDYEERDNKLKEKSEKDKYKERNKNNNNMINNNNNNNKTLTLPNHPEVSLINVKKTYYPSPPHSNIIIERNENTT